MGLTHPDPVRIGSVSGKDPPLAKGHGQTVTVRHMKRPRRQSYLLDKRIFEVATTPMQVLYAFT